MIKIDLLLAIAIYLSSILLVLLGEWILGNKNSAVKDISQDTRFILQCPICSFVFHDFGNTAISVCPRCKSYSKKEEAKI